MFLAGNQLGKTLAGGAETAMHLTGRYPDWWDGAEFTKPPIIWAAGVTNEGARDNPQRVLIGPPPIEEQWGTGTIPFDCLKDWGRTGGVQDLLDYAIIRWGGGGDVQAQDALVYFKSYEKGREKWQGPTIDAVWFDEEPPLDIYVEGLTRTNRGQLSQFVYITFTPLLGMSDVVSMFLLGELSKDGQSREPIKSTRGFVQMTIDDVDHYTEAEKEQIKSSYPAHERQARARGEPILGSGRVFPVAEEVISVEPFSIPKHWQQIGGIDFGIDHPFAAVNIAYDADADCLYVTKTYRISDSIPAIQCTALRHWDNGSWLPFAWPHDGLNRDKGSGEQLASIYRSNGLNMLEERATHEEGGNGVEAGLYEMLERMQTGRFKVFSNLLDWFEEFRLYHRKKGQIVKLRDDLMSATRIASMMLRHAQTAPVEFAKYAKRANVGMNP